MTSVDVGEVTLIAVMYLARVDMPRVLLCVPDDISVKSAQNSSLDVIWVLALFFLRVGCTVLYNLVEGFQDYLGHF